MLLAAFLQDKNQNMLRNTIILRLVVIALAVFILVTLNFFQADEIYVRCLRCFLSSSGFLS